MGAPLGMADASAAGRRTQEKAKTKTAKTLFFILIVIFRSEPEGISLGRLQKIYLFTLLIDYRYRSM